VKLLNLYILLCIATCSNMHCMQKDDYTYTAVDPEYEYQQNPLRVKNRKTDEWLSCKGYKGNIDSVIVKAGYVICSAHVLLHLIDEETNYRFSKKKQTLYIWDLEHRYDACGLGNFLKDTLCVDLNSLIGLYPIKKITHEFNADTIRFAHNYHNLVNTQGITILLTPNKMYCRLKKHAKRIAREESYKLLRQEKIRNRAESSSPEVAFYN